MRKIMLVAVPVAILGGSRSSGKSTARELIFVAISMMPDRLCRATATASSAIGMATASM